MLQGRQQFFGRFAALFPIRSERTHLIVNLFAVGIVCIRMFVPRIQLAAVIVITDRISRPPLFVQQFRRCHSAGVSNGGNGTSVGADEFFGTYGAVVFIKERMAGTVFVINRFAVQHAVFIIGSGLRVTVFVISFIGGDTTVIIICYGMLKAIRINQRAFLRCIFIFGFGLFVGFFIHFKTSFYDDGYTNLMIYYTPFLKEKKRFSKQGPYKKHNILKNNIFFLTKKNRPCFQGRFFV